MLVQVAWHVFVVDHKSPRRWYFCSTNQPLKDVWEIFWENNEVAWLVLIPKSIIILFCMWYLFPFNYWLLTGKGDNLADDSLPQINLLGIKLLEKGFPFSRQCNIHHPRRKKHNNCFLQKWWLEGYTFFGQEWSLFKKKLCHVQLQWGGWYRWTTTCETFPDAKSSTGVWLTR